MQGRGGGSREGEPATEGSGDVKSVEVGGAGRSEEDGGVAVGSTAGVSSAAGVAQERLT